MKLNKSIILGIFILVSLAQLAVPFSMIYEKESVVQEGKTYKFKTRPIDPYDPLRGKYITLRYETTPIEVDSSEPWEYGELAFFSIENDTSGFAKVTGVSKTKPTSGDFLEMEVTVLHHRYNANKTIGYKIPFNRFYMNEDEALNAELAYREVNRDRKKENAYAVVKIKDGEYVLEDVVIGGTSAKDLKQ